MSFSDDGLNASNSKRKKGIQLTNNIKLMLSPSFQFLGSSVGHPTMHHGCKVITATIWVPLEYGTSIRYVQSLMKSVQPCLNMPGGNQLYSEMVLGDHTLAKPIPGPQDRFSDSTPIWSSWGYHWGGTVHAGLKGSTYPRIFKEAVLPLHCTSG